MRHPFSAALLALAVAAPMAPGTAVAQGGQPYLSQQILVGFNYCPRGWAEANNQILPINSWQSLYSLMGPTYGGDGRTTFALPGLRGRVNVGVGTSTAGGFYTWGQKGGAETVSLQIANMVSHSHGITVAGTTTGPNAPVGAGALLATEGSPAYATGLPNVEFAAASVVESSVGASQPFDIRMPYETIMTCVAMQGIFPSRN